MNKTWKIIIAAVSTIVCAVAAGLSSYLIPRSRAIKSEKKETQGYYAGRVQSYLDVYKDIWNASVPEKHVEEAHGYDELVECTGEDRLSSFMSFCPINGVGTINDARQFQPHFGYSFETIFPDDAMFPYKYYAGKTVNMFIGFGTVSYSDKTKFSDEIFNNIYYFMTECDGRIAFYGSKMKYLTYGDYAFGREAFEFNDYIIRNLKNKDLLNSFLSFSVSMKPDFIGGHENPGENCCLFYEEDSQLIGVNYLNPFFTFVLSGKPVIKQTPDSPPYSGNFTCPLSIMTQMESGSRTPSPYRVDFEIDSSDLSLILHEETVVDIKSPNDLLSDYLKEFKYEYFYKKKVRRGITGKYVRIPYYVTNGYEIHVDSMINRFASEQYYDIKVFSSDVFPSVVYKPSLSFKCIPLIGNDWHPSRMFPGIKEYTNLRIKDGYVFCDN